MDDQESSGSRTAGHIHVEGLSGSHPSQDGEEALFGDHDPSDEDLVDISGKYVHMADNLEEMVRDAMGYDEYNMSIWLTIWRKWCVMPRVMMGILMRSLRN